MLNFDIIFSSSYDRHFRQQSVSYRTFKFAFARICDVKFTFGECDFLLNSPHPYENNLLTGFIIS